MAWLVPTLHPAGLYRDPTLQFAMHEDLRKAVRVQKEGPTRVPPTIQEWQWMPDLEQVGKWLHMPKLGCPISCDFESTLDGRVVCLGLWECVDPTIRKGICIPFLRQGDYAYWKPAEEEQVKRWVWGFLQDPAIKKVGQNIVGFDFGYPPFNSRSLVKRAWGIDVRGIIGDTYAAHALCYAELPHGLGFQASIGTDLGAFKEDPAVGTKKADKWGRILDRDDKDLRVYNLLDAFSTAVIWNDLEKEMA